VLLPVHLAQRKRRLHDGLPPAARATITDSSVLRWEEMLASLTALLPRRARRVLVDGPAAQADLRTAKLAPRG
jgi:hypothetical protein